jgi:Predicted membrane protein (DUF2306)
MALNVLYAATTALCIFMLFWILVLPSSALHGFSSILDEKRYQIELFANHIPPNLFSKFRGHHTVHFTHTFPSAIWSAIIPFQLHPGFRKRNRRLHRLLGYVFSISSFLMMIGLVIILQRKLLFVHFLSGIPIIEVSLNEILQLVLGAWFSWTCIKAIREARLRNLVAHRNWILRHIGSGIWIALMRILLLLVKPIFSTSAFDGPMSPSIKSKLFSTTGTLAIMSTISLSEISIWLIKSVADASDKIL